MDDTARDTAGEDEVLAPVPDPTDDLTHLAVFDEDPAPDGATGASTDGTPEALAPTAYDDETDLALPVHQPDTTTAFVPYGASVADVEPATAYDRERDTGL